MVAGLLWGGQGQDLMRIVGGLAPRCWRGEKGFSWRKGGGVNWVLMQQGPAGWAG